MAWRLGITPSTCSNKRGAARNHAMSTCPVCKTQFASLTIQTRHHWRCSLLGKALAAWFAVTLVAGVLTVVLYLMRGRADVEVYSCTAAAGFIWCGLRCSSPTNVPIGVVCPLWCARPTPSVLCGICSACRCSPRPVFYIYRYARSERIKQLAQKNQKW